MNASISTRPVRSAHVEGACATSRGSRPIGFSQRTCLPASSARIDHSTWSDVRQRDVDRVDVRGRRAARRSFPTSARTPCSAAYASARAASRLAAPTTETSSDSAAPLMISSLIWAVESRPSRSAFMLPPVVVGRDTAPVARVAVVVRAVPGRVGLDDDRATTTQRATGVADVREDARARRRRAAPLRRPRPPRPPCARAGCRAPRRRCEATARSARRRPRRGPTSGSTPSSRSSSSESRSPNATPSSTARTSAPRSCRSVRPTNAPRASGSACGVRSPARYGWKSRPSAAGRPALRLARRAPRTARRPTSRSQRSEPAAESITPIACQRARHGVAEGVHARLADRRRTPAGRRTRRPTSRARPRAGRAGRCRRRARRRPDRPLPARPERPATRTRGGSHARGQLQRVEHLVATSAGRATSKSSVPDASAASMARSPVRRSRT